MAAPDKENAEPDREIGEIVGKLSQPGELEPGGGGARGGGPKPTTKRGAREARPHSGRRRPRG
ncbi:hypothetical protein, partial [Nonomuraea sp. NPDC059022]|uniref:hypothetical protein n=1 Tax=Nonomuraea sp. NPDC059022 TaxID=3346705 RepID=UPI003681C7C9